MLSSLNLPYVLLGGYLGLILFMAFITWDVGDKIVGLFYRMKYEVKVLKQCVKDPRVPRFIKWLVGIGLVVKLWPIDFGLDEILLGSAILLMVTRYRKVWNEIREEVRNGANKAVS